MPTFTAVQKTDTWAPSDLKQYWFPWCCFIIALSLRLWNLGTPPQIVSDEISFVNDGRDYVTHQTYFDPHPPLGKMEIGAAIKLFGDRPYVWRFVGAIEGALIAPLLWWIVWRLTRRRAAANIAAILTLLDGLLLVDSRLGLINVPYLLAALAALACALKALEARRPWRWLLTAGICVGAAIATKWLAVLVAAPLVAMWLWPTTFGQRRHPEQLRQPCWLIVATLGIVPLIIYWLVFVVHFAWLGIPQAFWSANMQMLNYHLSVPAIGDPNQQPWWGWLLAWRPFPYWTDVSNGQISIIRSLPNPWLWWSGSVLVVWGLVRGWHSGTGRLMNALLLCAWIPFAFIQRVMYSYHGLLFDIWMIVLLAAVLGRWWEQHRRPVMVYLFIATAAFVWFAPWYLNIPLSLRQHKLRQWLPTWTIQT